MKIRDLKLAIATFKEISLVHIDAQYEGNRRLVNKTYKQLDEIFNYIKLNNAFSELLPLLSDQDDRVRFSAAVELLKTEYRESALNGLKNLSQGESKMANNSHYALIADKKDSA